MTASETNIPSPMRRHVMVIESHERHRSRLRDTLSSIGFRVTVAGTAFEAIQVEEDFYPDVLLTSLMLTDVPGLAVIDMLKDRLGIPIISMSSSPTLSGAVESIRRGAVDYINTFASPDELDIALSKAIRETRSSRELDQVKQQVKDRFGFSSLLTQSPRMLDVFDQVRKVASTDATVLIRGETGTGKELISRAIHERSERAEKPFIAVNCGAFTETLLESELFGHERGSFTGAVGKREGLFEMANGGTLFLDELGETSLNVQVNLLRVLEEMRFRRVGGRDSIRVDVRIIAATNVELETAVAEKRFREDLYYRLNVYPILLPPLRSRSEDIPLLIRHFIDDASLEYGLEPPVVASDALVAAMSYSWPGNVRQLRAVCERWVITRSGQRVETEHLPAEWGKTVASQNHRGGFHIDEAVSLGKNTARAVAQIEKLYLHRILKTHEGRIGNAADAAGITRRTLYTKMKLHGLDANEYRR